jgi:hypothetical protein
MIYLVFLASIHTLKGVPAKMRFLKNFHFSSSFHFTIMRFLCQNMAVDYTPLSFILINVYGDLSSAQAPAPAGLSLALFSISLTHPPPPALPSGKVANLEN